jgi:hypothetical protein
MDHILEVNGTNAMRLSHKQTVEQIRKVCLIRIVFFSLLCVASVVSLLSCRSDYL